MAATVPYRVRPNPPDWPSAAEWQTLGDAVEGRLQPVIAPVPAPTLDLLSNPFFLRDQPALTQSSGWIDCWQSLPSAYVVRAATPSDVSAAVRFAARHRLRLVVKGAGHSYLGRSSAPDSLLVWTRDMQTISVHDGFVPEGVDALPVPAISVGAGCTWGQLYDVVTTRNGRYVQGGGCTTVGVAGLVQAGGFGTFSKTFGLAAAGLLEAEVVTADGTVDTVNAVRDPDLFWALKGGGGGTFCVVTRLTLRTDELPATFGFVNWSVRASSDASFADLLQHFVASYAARLFNPHWGEQASATPNNRLVVRMAFQGLNEGAARHAWSDLAGFVASRPKDYAVEEPLEVRAVPARWFWDEAALREHAPHAIQTDRRPDAQPGNWWWTATASEVGTFWHGYQSTWLSRSLLTSDQGRLVGAWVAASRHWPVTLHFNKGLAGAPDAAIAASRNTAMNPQVLDAFALAIIAADGPSAFPGLPAPNLVEARRNAMHISNAMTALRHAAPGAGSYLDQCDYHLENWQEACWGEHRLRLSMIKQRVDPHNLFVVHHGVGS